jgi:hypothetical protein
MSLERRAHKSLLIFMAHPMLGGGRSQGIEVDDIAVWSNHLIDDIPQSAEQVPGRRIVVRQVNDQTQRLDANLLAITVFVRGPKPSNIDAQPIILLPRTQFGAARQVSLDVVHMTSDRLTRLQLLSVTRLHSTERSLSTTFREHAAISRRTDR